MAVRFRRSIKENSPIDLSGRPREAPIVRVPLLAHEEKSKD